MAHPGHIIVKDSDNGKLDYRRFYGPLDKGAARPSFCYPKRKDELAEEVRSMERAMASGYVAPDKKMSLEIDLNKRKERLDKLNEQEDKARKIFEADKDEWMNRRKELAKEITAETPTRDDVTKRKVNPHRTLQKEKGGLQDKKTEYIVISRLAGEESNVSYLRKDK